MQTDEIIKIKIPDFANETALSLAKNRDLNLEINLYKKTERKSK
jgi:hypothetical protein